MSLRKVASKLEKSCVGGSEYSEHRRGPVHSMHYAKIMIVISICIMGFKTLEFRNYHPSLIKCKMNFDANIEHILASTSLISPPLTKKITSFLLNKPK